MRVFSVDNWFNNNSIIYLCIILNWLKAHLLLRIKCALKNESLKTRLYSFFIHSFIRF